MVNLPHKNGKLLLIKILIMMKITKIILTVKNIIIIITFIIIITIKIKCGRGNRTLTTTNTELFVTLRNG